MEKVEQDDVEEIYEDEVKENATWDKLLCALVDPANVLDLVFPPHIKEPTSDQEYLSNYRRSFAVDLAKKVLVGVLCISFSASDYQSCADWDKLTRDGWVSILCVVLLQWATAAYLLYVMETSTPEQWIAYNEPSDKQCLPTTPPEAEKQPVKRKTKGANDHHVELTEVHVVDEMERSEDLRDEESNDQKPKKNDDKTKVKDEPPPACLVGDFWHPTQFLEFYNVGLLGITLGQQGSSVFVFLSSIYDLVTSLYFLRYDKNASIHCLPVTSPKTKYDELPCYAFPTARMEKRQMWAKSWFGFMFFLWSLIGFAGNTTCHILCPNGPFPAGISCPPKSDMFGWSLAYNASLPPGADVWTDCQQINNKHETYFNYENQSWSWIDSNNQSFPLDICYLSSSPSS